MRITLNQKCWYLWLVQIMIAVNDRQFECHHSAIANPFGVGWHLSKHSPMMVHSALLSHQTLVLSSVKFPYQWPRQPKHSANTLAMWNQNTASASLIRAQLSNDSMCHRTLLPLSDMPIYKQDWCYLSVYHFMRGPRRRRRNWKISRTRNLLERQKKN